MERTVHLHTRLARRLIVLHLSLAIAAASVVLATAQRQFDVIIRGGDVLDGSGAPATRADVGIRGDIIVEIGELSTATGLRTINAAGLIVAPGFIDMHSHSDYSVLVDGRALSKVMQGVTTELLGESDSAGPVLGPVRQEREKSLADLGLALDWTSLQSYFARVERQRVSVNLLSTVASGTIRGGVVGFENRPATPIELQRMVDLVDEAMGQGAVGLSSGLIYPPDSYASTEELIALSRAAARHGGIYVTHLRSEGDGLLQALDEAIRIARDAGIQVEVLHFKRSSVSLDAASESGTIREAAARIEQAQRDGVRIYANVYPYAASSTTLAARLPDWVTEGGTERLLERLRSPETRAKIRAELESLFSRGVAGVTPATILLSRTPYEPHRALQGKRLAEIATWLGLSAPDAMIELIDKGEGRVGAIFFSMREEDVEFALTRPWTTIGSDGSALSPDGILARSNPHPRSYGTFPRVLGRYVRGRQALTLPDAIRKMTSLPASRLGLTDRGTLRAGWKADIVVFDSATIADRATFEAPHQLSTGVRWLLVNGDIVIDDGRHTGAMPGRILRHRRPLNAAGRALGTEPVVAPNDGAGGEYGRAPRGARPGQPLQPRHRRRARAVRRRSPAPECATGFARAPTTQHSSSARHPPAFGAASGPSAWWFRHVRGHHARRSSEGRGMRTADPNGRKPGGPARTRRAGTRQPEPMCPLANRSVPISSQRGGGAV